jgi:hypothetical protein
MPSSVNNNATHTQVLWSSQSFNGSNRWDKATQQLVLDDTTPDTYVVTKTTSSNRKGNVSVSYHLEATTNASGHRTKNFDANTDQQVFSPSQRGVETDVLGEGYAILAPRMRLLPHNPSAPHNARFEPLTAFSPQVMVNLGESTFIAVDKATDKVSVATTFKAFSPEADAIRNTMLGTVVHLIPDPEEPLKWREIRVDLNDDGLTDVIKDLSKPTRCGHDKVIIWGQPTTP